MPATMQKITPVLMVERIEHCLLFWERLGFANVAQMPHGDHLGFVMLVKDAVEVMYCQYYYVQDAEGNVTGLLNASGAVVETYAHTPQGELVGGGGGVANPYRYKGREWDAEAGLYYMRARYYDPGTSRFISEDPIGVSGGVGIYTFGESDPVNFPGCTPSRTVVGVFGDPGARVVALSRRPKKWSAAGVDARTAPGTTARSAGCAISRAATCGSISTSKCGASIAGAVAA